LFDRKAGRLGGMEAWRLGCDEGTMEGSGCGKLLIS